VEKPASPISLCFRWQRKVVFPISMCLTMFSRTRSHSDQQSMAANTQQRIVLLVKFITHMQRTPE